MVSSFNTKEWASDVDAVKSQQHLSFKREELISFIDLTSLNETDTEASIATFCRKAITPFGQVAALCVYPRFVKQVGNFLKGSGIQLAAVANFPQGDSALPLVSEEIQRSLEDGAQEIDLVFPYQRYLAGEREFALHFVKQCKAICGAATLKVILETGAFSDFNLLAEATQGVIVAGADFVKTATGKGPSGATLEAAAVILRALQASAPSDNRPLGLKVSGGIRDPFQAAQYLLLAKNIMGQAWPRPQTFRLGASHLLDQLVTPSV